MRRPEPRGRRFAGVAKAPPRRIASLTLIAACALGCSNEPKIADVTVPDYVDAASEASTPEAGPDQKLDARATDTRAVADSPPDAPPRFDATLDASDATTALIDPSVDANADSAPPVSLFCPDTIRDPTLEECDDGPGDADDSCTPDCRVRNTSVVPSHGPARDAAPGTPERSLGTGPHVASANDDGFCIAYTETYPQNAGTAVWIQFFDQWGGRDGEPIEVSGGTEPTENANPVVAALPQAGMCAAFWTEVSGGTQDIAMRVLQRGQAVTSTVRHAHAGRAAPQSDPDVILVGPRVVAAWTDLLTVRYREFSFGLAPFDTEQALSPSSAIQSNVSLAPTSDGWAAAWRENEDGLEFVVVKEGDQTWYTEATSPGPIGDRPAVVELDSDHLFVVFTVGTDPLDTGTATVGRLRSAILDRSEPGFAESAPLMPVTPPFDTDETLAQRRPSATRVGDHVFVAWETESPDDEDLGREVWLQQVRLGSDDAIEPLDERPLQIDATRLGDQRRPALASSPLFPEGALIAVHEDWSPGARTGPELVLGFRPTPFVSLPSGDGGSVVAAQSKGFE